MRNSTPTLCLLFAACGVRSIEPDTVVQELPGDCDPQCGSCPPSPIILDLSGNGFSLTNAADGVFFDVIPGGNLERVGWTSPGSDDAWLAEDRNGDGQIEDGSELFGNYTVQTPSRRPNGFLALVELDDNHDG